MNQKIGTLEHSPNSNSKKDIRARRWFFTWNNYTKDSIDSLLLGLKGYLYVFQEEKGELGTPHLQGCFEHKHPVSFYTLTKKYPGCHWKQTRNAMAARAYCQKLDTRDGEIFTNIPAPYKYSIKDPYIWQQQILDLLKTEPDDRTIHWYWEPKGNCGKTALCKHIKSWFEHVIYCDGKANDMKFAIVKKLQDHQCLVEIILMDISRSVEHISYGGLESIKNGIFFSGKYESTDIMIKPPHVICFSNQEPDTDKMSLDRWHIVDISKVGDNLDGPYNAIGLKPEAGPIA